MSSAVVIICTLAILAIFARRMNRWEVTCAWAACVLHVGFSWVQVWLHTRFYHGVGDMFGYVSEGGAMARLISIDFSRFGWAVLKVFLHMRGGPGMGGEVSSTESMSAATALILFGVGDSMLAACVFLGALATVSQTVLYLVLRSEVPPASRKGAAIVTFLIPSVLFWSSAVTKESLTLSFLAFLAAGALLVRRGRWALGGTSVVAGAVGVAMLKPYVLFPFIVGLVAWGYVARVQRGRGRFRLLHVALAAGFAFLGLALAGTLFPEYSFSHLAQEAARQQQVGAEVGGGSYVHIGDAEARTFWQQLPFLPVAFIDSMFRPFLFEVRNAPMLGAALESSVLTIASVALLARLRWRRALGAVQRSPLLAFCVVFTGTFAIAVGLATTNLGTLSRYRMPMMPTYALAVFLLWQELRVPAGAHKNRERPRDVRIAAPSLNERSSAPRQPSTIGAAHQKR